MNALGDPVLWVGVLAVGGGAVLTLREFGLLLCLCSNPLHPFYFGGRVHAAPAVLATAVTRGFVFPVVKPVVVSDFLSGLQITKRLDNDAAIDFVGLAIRVTGMIHEHGHAVSVDHDSAVANPKEVRKGAAVVAYIAFFLGDAFTRVFEYDRSLGNIFEGETTGGMNV